MNRTTKPKGHHIQSEGIVRRLVFALILAGTSQGIVLAQGQSLSPLVVRYAEMVLYNGRVLTVDEKFTVHQAVAIRDGSFLAVGTSQEILALAGPETRKIDLQGRSVVPGLFDTHLHQAWVGQVAKGEGADMAAENRGRVQFKDVASGLEEVKKIVAQVPPKEWIYVSGPDNNPLLHELKLAQLDALTPVNPFVITTTNNLGFINTVALNTLPPGIGGVEKDTTGKPTGIISGFALGDLTYERMTVGPATEAALRLQQEVLRKLNSQGLTTIVGRAQGTSVSILKELWSENKLTARVRIAHEFLRQNAKAENYLKRLGNLTGFGDERMKIIGATIQPADGTSNQGAMLTKSPKNRMIEGSAFGLYGQDKFQNYGSTFETSEYHNIILANRYGWNILAVHSQGDGAADLLLQAFAQANKERPLKGVWGFDHGLSRTAENIARATELGVIFSVAPKYLFMDSPETLVYQYGEEVHRMSPVRNMIRGGMKPVMESDITGTYSAPLWNMERLITRTDDKGRTWGANQKITREEALRMKTSWAARYSADEKILGSIEAGKLADLVVLGGDYLSVPENQIAALPIDLTVVDGKVVYDRAKDGDIRLDYWDKGRY